MEKPWKVVLTFIGVFLAGAVFGGLVSLRVGRSVLQERERNKQPGSTVILPPKANVNGVAVGGTPGPLQSSPPQPKQPPVFVGQQAQAAQLLKRFTERLDLTAEQRERLTPLIQRATADFRRQQQTQFREDTIVLQRLQEDIRKELTPDQIAKLDQMEEKQRKILEKRQSDEQAAQNAKNKPNQRPGKPQTQFQAAPAPVPSSSQTPPAPSPTSPPPEKP